MGSELDFLNETTSSVAANCVDQPGKHRHGNWVVIGVAAGLLILLGISAVVALSSKGGSGASGSSKNLLSAVAVNPDHDAIIKWMKEHLPDPNFEIVKWHEPVAVTEYYDHSDYHKGLKSEREMAKRTGALFYYVRFRAKTARGMTMDGFLFELSKGEVTRAQYAVIWYCQEHCKDPEDSSMLISQISQPNTILLPYHGPN